MTEIKFTLKGVFLRDLTKKSSKFHAKVKKRPQTKIHAKTTTAGYTVKIANLLSVKFESDNDKQRCWWDHHEYDDSGVCIPYKYERIGQMHHVSGKGSFCSMFCLWAYLLEEQKKQYHLRDFRLEKSIELTQFLFSKMYTDDVALKPSPDWRLLDCYGGHLTINEFRKSSYEKTYTSLGNVVFDPAVIQYLVE